MKRHILISLFLLTFFCVNSVFAQNEKKIHYGILLDNTGSMRYHLDRIVELAREVLDRMTVRDSVSLFYFKEDDPAKSDSAKVKVGIEATRDIAVAREHINNLSIVGGRTTLFDAILVSAEKISLAAGDDENAEKVLIVITDGENRTSKISRQDLIKHLRERRVKVYAVGFTQELESKSGFRPRDAKERAEKFLKEMSAETGGKAVFPSAKDDIGSLIENLLSEKKQ